MAPAIAARVSVSFRIAQAVHPGAGELAVKSEIGPPWLLNELEEPHAAPRSKILELMVRFGVALSDRQRMIGERQVAVRNLGNLTLLNLSVNRQVQNHAFTEKRDLLIANTNLRLNIPLIPLQVWDEQEIAKRGNLLTETALQLWPGPRP